MFDYAVRLALWVCRNFATLF